MDAMKEALKRKMDEHAGKKPGLEIAIGIGKPKPDQEHADGQTEGDAMYMDKKKMQEENDLAPESHDVESEGHEMIEQSKMDKVLEHEGEEHDMLKQILGALADKGMGGGRPPSTLGERAAMGAKAKLGAMMKK